MEKITEWIIWNLWTCFHAVHVAVYLLINLLIVSSAVESAFTAREGMQAVVLGKPCNTEDEKGPSHTCNFDNHGLFPIFALQLLYHTPPVIHTLSPCSTSHIPPYIMSYSNHHSGFDSETYFWSQ